MVPRRDLIKNLEYITPRLYWLCERVYPDKPMAKKLFQDCLSVLAVQTKGRAFSLGLEEKLVSSYLFKKSISTLFKLLKRRTFQIDENASPFYQLSPMARVILLLKYRLEFQTDEILKMGEMDLLELEDEIFRAQGVLEKNLETHRENSL